MHVCFVIFLLPFALFHSSEVGATWPTLAQLPLKVLSSARIQWLPVLLPQAVRSANGELIDDFQKVAKKAASVWWASDWSSKTRVEKGIDRIELRATKRIWSANLLTNHWLTWRCYWYHQECCYMEGWPRLASKSYKKWPMRTRYFWWNARLDKNLLYFSSDLVPNVACSVSRNDVISCPISARAHVPALASFKRISDISNQ